jgi:disulfide bond formation protein DsbB
VKLAVSLMFRPRVWFLFVALICAGMLAFGLYVQHVEFLDPCPLCVFQRLALIWIGLVALVACLHGPAGRTGQWIYGVLVSLGGLAGLGIAGRHLWLQSLPPDRVPDCGMGLNYMLDTLPFRQVLVEVFYGSGECAEIDWTLLGLSMPGWTFLWYAFFTAGTIIILTLANRSRTTY